MLETLQIPYVINTNMVRGLDYYNHTIFEFTTEVAGGQLTICAGGRYDGLVAYFGWSLRHQVSALVWAWNACFSSWTSKVSRASD